jgi:hypothetical protein
LLVDDPAIRRRKMFNCEHLIRIVVEISPLRSSTLVPGEQTAQAGENA